MSLAVKGVSGGNKLEAKLEELAAKAKDARVRVGILEGATYPDGTPTALVGFVQEFGAEIDVEAREQVVHFKKNKKGQTRFAKADDAQYGMKTKVGKHQIVIPPRSFMRSTVMQRQEAWRDGLKKMVKEQGYDLEKALAKLGLEMVGNIKTQISAITSPPLKPETAARKGHDKPLIDKKQLINSIDSEIAAGSTE